MTYFEPIEMYPNDPPMIVYHGFYPEACKDKELASTPMGNGRYHPSRYKLSKGIEASLTKATLGMHGLNLELEVNDKTEQFAIPYRDFFDFADDMNLKLSEMLMMIIPSAMKPEYKNIRVTAFLNKFNKNEIFGMLALTRFGDDKHLYADRHDQVYFMTYPDGMGIGAMGDPGILDHIGDFQSRNYYLNFD
ncbi:MAG: hypothetical protein NDI94_06310 [Candidatus Woesearchaeota archaeon]|nr:hypothetical protein [Candidatus Woesearchaeota archaeon]